jgi:DNA-binding transcriptional ArsR family regulator
MKLSELTHFEQFASCIYRCAIYGEHSRARINLANMSHQFQSSAIPPDLYRAHQMEISLHMSHFFLGYLKHLHALFDGDLTLVIVLAEIAHHSSGPLVDAKTSGQNSRPDSDEALAGMLSCSAYSLATATGIPRETVRRKIARLTELGWVEKIGRAEVRITRKVGDHFMPDFNLILLGNLLKTAENIRNLLKP